jgi:hypothetical protein
LANSKKNNLNFGSQLSVKFSICLALSVIMIYGSTAAILTMNAFGQTQALPTCPDPTGNNLPCLMVLSTLPTPVNAVQCQETTGQILSCSYATQTLSNGQQIVVITVYVPANFVFGSGTVVKVVVHGTTNVIHNTKTVRVFPPHTPDYNYGFAEGLVEGKYGVYDAAAACVGAKNLDHCITGYHDAFLQVCIKSKNGCGDAIVNYPPPIPQPICKLSPLPGVQVSCPGMPVPSIKPSAGSGPICIAGNCTSGPIPTKVDCTKNPSDPSCQQQHHTAAYLQALKSGAPNPYKLGTMDYEHYQAGLVARQQSSGAVAGIATVGGTNGNNNNPPSPTTKKCPDGSTIPVKDKCPTSKQTNPPSLSTGSSAPSSTSGSLSSPSGGSSSGGESGSSGGGSGGSSSSSSGSSSGSSSNSDSGSHHRH